MVGGDFRDPVQDREQGKASSDSGIHLGAVDHGILWRIRLPKDRVFTNSNLFH